MFYPGYILLSKSSDSSELKEGLTIAMITHDYNFVFNEARDDPHGIPDRNDSRIYYTMIS